MVVKIPRERFKCGCGGPAAKEKHLRILISEERFDLPGGSNLGPLTQGDCN